MEPALVANYRLHPSGLQYTRWVGQVLNYVDSTRRVSTRKKLRSNDSFTVSNPVSGRLVV